MISAPPRTSRLGRAATLAALALVLGSAGSAAILARTEPVVQEVPPAAAPTAPLPARREAGVFHVLRQGQTLYAVSRAYGVPVETLSKVNGITDPTRIPAGSALFVPGARRTLELASPSLPQLAWPIAGKVTSTFETPGLRPEHEGIDISGSMGEEVRAAAAGRVLWTGSERGYGEMVILDHGGGLCTAYAHASGILVEPDQTLNAGDPVALVGDSGNARGPHLHFEVRRNGRPVDPLPYLGKSAARARREHPGRSRLPVDF
jgi:murein DD-endopeptidase MepM/ murein hydrolase activator NlpD